MWPTEYSRDDNKRCPRQGPERIPACSPDLCTLEKPGIMLYGFQRHPKNKGGDERDREKGEYQRGKEKSRMYTKQQKCDPNRGKNVRYDPAHQDDYTLPWGMRILFTGEHETPDFCLQPNSDPLPPTSYTPASHPTTSHPYLSSQRTPLSSFVLSGTLFQNYCLVSLGRDL